MSLGIYKNNTMGVVQFISTTVYFLLFQSTADRNHPSVMAFEVYIQRILNCSTNNVTVPVIFTALFYVDRYSKRLRLNGISRRDSEAQILVASLMLADVYHNDAAYAVCSWSELSSFSLQECIQMRRQFLEIIDYDLFLSFEQYSRWIVELKRISNLVATVMHYNQTKIAAPTNTPQLSYQSLMRNTNIQPTLVYPSPSHQNYNTQAGRRSSLMSGNNHSVNRGASDSSLIVPAVNSGIGYTPTQLQLVRSRSGHELTYSAAQIVPNSNVPPPVCLPQSRNNSIPFGHMDRKNIVYTPIELNQPPNPGQLLLNSKRSQTQFISPPVQPQGTDLQPQGSVIIGYPADKLSNTFPSRIRQPY